ncbi:probable septum site-determining protein MinC [Brachyspira sp. CAG:484]|nr:probable septum site-determining protein MinC [Brachyspira sp. CAG:484]
MEKGYVENGFIVDLANAKKTSEIIYELSRILDMPEAKNKNVCLKLGELALSSSELISIKALIETMESRIEFISTSSPDTEASAKDLGIEVSKIENVVPALNIEASAEDNQTVNEELETALDKIFGEGDFEERYPEEDTEETTVSDNEKEIVVEEVEDVVDYEEVKRNNKETEKLPTLYIHRTLRSGQSLTSEGNIVVIGDVNPGAEIVAKGDITVWGVLGGIAHAGSDGNTYSRIRALKLNAIQLRIGDIFARRPDTGNMPYVQKSDTFTPEEARVSKKHIMIYRLHES